MRRRIAVAVAAAAVAASSAVAVQAPASADIGGGGDGDNFTLAVNVQVSAGKGDPVPSGTLPVYVPPQCWWQPVDLVFNDWSKVDADDPEAFDKWLDEILEYGWGSFSFAKVGLPSRAYVKEIIRKEQAGADHTWYQLHSQEGVNCADLGFSPTAGTLPGYITGNGTQSVPYRYQAFPAGAPAPEPLVDVEDVVTEIWKYAEQELEDPDVDRNPKATAQDDATLIHLPTWFWVTNTDGALARDGRIHLALSIPGTPVQATLDAETDGLSVTSPAGSTECSIAAAQVAYRDGVSEDSACTIAFDRENKGGWPVTASITWTGSWQGTDAAGSHSGQLDAIGHSTTVDVPVIERGTVVTDVD